ncbi:hypothetical protein [Streptomyces sp. NPDC050856]|uniref:hypothetical protein n=1 Tax=Streptomyces sp. NPDC050856 TaxID=3154939 RepID=UPI0033DDC09A
MAETKKTTTQAGTATKERVQNTADTAREGKDKLSVIGGATTEKARSAARGVQATVGSAAGRAVGKVGVAWTLVKARKAVVAGAGAGVATVVASSYALGLRSGLRRRGPLSRLTGGRL